MNEGQNDNLSTKSLPTHKAARTISSALVQYVYMKERETDKQRQKSRNRQTKRGREKERGMSMYLHGSLVVRIAPVAGS